MEHPLIHDADSLKTEDLSSKINDLNKKLGIARKLGNSYLIGQILMAIETYREVLSRKQREQLEKTSGDINKLADRIDIS